MNGIYIERVSPRASTGDHNFSGGIHQQMALEYAGVNLIAQFKGERVVAVEDNSMVLSTHLDSKMWDAT